MAVNNMNGLGYRDGVHWKERAAVLGVVGEPTLGPGSDLWQFTEGGVVISRPLVTNEMHAWLDEFEESGVVPFFDPTD